MANDRLRAVLFCLLALACLHPAVSSALALLMGVFLGLSVGNPFPDATRKMTHRLLTWSIVGLGAGMNLEVVGRVGAHGVLYTAVGIGLTLLLGKLLGRALGCSAGVSTLVSVGTAICGGSAIAAVAPVLHSKHEDVSVSLATVFLLNAAALLLFPWIGHHLALDQNQFGLWSALAIHDTSSVVGATMQYGRQALEVGTTVKLARALWIIPVTLIFSWIGSRTSSESDRGEKVKSKKPWFILGFLIAAALVTWVPALQAPGHLVEELARRLLVLTLFLIGASLTRRTLAVVGIRPLLQGLILWIVVGSATLMAIDLNWISL